MILASNMIEEITISQTEIAANRKCLGLMETMLIKLRMLKTLNLFLQSRHQQCLKQSLQEKTMMILLNDEAGSLTKIFFVQREKVLYTKYLGSLVQS